MQNSLEAASKRDSPDTPRWGVRVGVGRTVLFLALAALAASAFSDPGVDLLFQRY